MPFRPTLCLDFDGVLHSYTSEWKGADTVPDPPVPGAQDFVRRAMKEFDVVVLSSRSHQIGGMLAMQDWMKSYDFPAVQFPREKPPAFLTIDDRALTFDGSWPDIGKLLEFKPWNRR